MDNIVQMNDVNNFKLYQVRIYINGNFEFQFLSDTSEKKVRNVIKKFHEYIYNNEIYRNQMKEEFYKFLKENKVNYKLPDTISIVL